MSRCAHAQSTYKLAKLPECSKCKAEMFLVYAVYDENSKFVKEWECSRCGRISSLSQIRGPQFSGEDTWLSEWCKKNEKQ